MRRISSQSVWVYECSLISLLALFGALCIGCQGGKGPGGQIVDTQPGAGDERVAPSRGHLEWSDREYQRYKIRLSEMRQAEPFADSATLIDRFLKDADTLHSEAREAYKQALNGPRDKAMGLAFIYNNPLVHLGAIVTDAENFDNYSTGKWKPDCVSRAQTSLSDLTGSDAKFDQLAAILQNEEMVRQLRKWSLASHSILNEVYAHAQADEKFSTIVSIEHGQMLQQHIALRLAFYYGMEDRSKVARQAPPRP